MICGLFEDVKKIKDRYKNNVIDYELVTDVMEDLKMIDYFAHENQFS